MRTRSTRWLAWLLYVGALTLVAVAAGLWLVVHRPMAGAAGYGYWREGMVTTLAFATVGALITTRRPEHPVGWLFLGAGLVGAAQLATGEFAAAFLAASGTSAGVAVAAWASSQFQEANVGLHGRRAGRRPRPGPLRRPAVGADWPQAPGGPGRCMRPGSTRSRQSPPPWGSAGPRSTATSLAPAAG